MTTSWSTPRKRYGWVVGAAVLVALLGTVVWMLQADERLGARLGAKPAAPVPPSAATSPIADGGAIPQLTQPSQKSGDATVRGVVLAPDGRPAEGATVTVYRLRTAWPEWDRLVLDTAFPGPDGVFQFRIPDTHGLLVGIKHTNAKYAETLAEVPLHGESMTIRLEPGFSLMGVVTNYDGRPVQNAHVAVESVPGDSRRAQVRVTSNNGSFRFTNLPAGPARLVARHDEWLPAVVSAVVVGDQPRVDLKFTRPAMEPLRGRVVVAGTDTPVAGAQIEALPLTAKLGLVDPRKAVSDGNGEFRITGLARGSTRLFVRHEKYGAMVTTQTAGGVSSQLVVELPLRSTVAGRLVVDSGPPLWRGGEVLRIRDAVGQLDHVAVEPDGSFRFPLALSPGWAALQVLDAPFAFQRSLTAEVDVRIDEAVATDVELVVVTTPRLRGRLVAADGRPLAGASLYRTKLLAEGARTITDAAAQIDLGVRELPGQVAFFGSQVAQLFASDRDELVATTAKDGTFEIRGQKPGPLLLRASSPGHGTRLLRELVGSVGSTRDLGTITLSPGRRMQGTVQRGGRPLAGANVLVVGIEDHAPQAMAVTDERGAWSVDDLMPGEYRVRARLPSKPAGFGLRTERVLAQGPPTNVVMVVEAGRILRGEVVGSYGQPVPGAIVAVRGAIGVAATATDANGDFAIELEERATELQVALADRSRPTVVPVPTGDDRLTIALDTPPTCTILASIAGLPGKKRIGAAVVRTTRLDGESAGEVRSRWMETPDGELSWSLCPAGRVRIEIWCEGFAPWVLEERDLAANERHDLGSLLLEPACRLAGVVVDGAGQPVADAVVMVGEEADLDLSEGATRTAADGSFVIGGLSSRSERVVVRGTGFAVRVVDVRMPSDVLRKDPLRIVLERGATIDVVVARSLARDGGYLELRRDGRVVASAEMSDDGPTSFANRSPGTYTVHLVGDARIAKAVAVEAGARVVRVQLP